MPKTTSHCVYLILILVIVGSFLRFYKIQSAPYWMDEGFTINAVLSIQEHGTEILDSGNKYSCPLYCYPTAWFGDIFGDDALSYRLLAAVSGILFIAMLFLIVRRLYSVRLAGLVSLFTTFSYFQIAWSRQARWYTLFELFFWPAIFFFYKAYYQRNRRYLSVVLAAVFSVLAILSHGLGYLLPVIFVGWIFIDKLIKRELSWKIVLPIAAIAVIPCLYIAHRFGIELSYVFPYYLNFYLRSYWLFILLSIVAVIHPNNKHKKETRFLLFVLLAYVIPLSFFTNLVNYRYLFHLTPIFFILGAVGLEAILSDIGKKWQKYAAVAVVLILFFASGEGVLIPRSMYFLEADDPTSILIRNRNSYLFVPQPDWNGAYSYIEQHLQANDIVITTEPPFNKIFLGQPGYWLRYSYNGKTYMPENGDKEFYVGATIVRDTAGLQSLVSSTHGFIVIDYYAEHLVPKDIVSYIETNLQEVFHEKTNSYSSISVYQF